MYTTLPTFSKFWMATFPKIISFKDDPRVLLDFFEVIWYNTMKKLRGSRAWKVKKSSNLVFSISNVMKSGFDQFQLKQNKNN